MKLLKSWYRALEGRKTYIIAAVVALVTFAKIIGWLTPSEFQDLLGVLGALGLTTLRLALENK